MIFAMALLVLLTFVIALITVSARFASVKNGTVKARYFRLMQGQEVPEFITKSGRNFNNQFEVPTLFYVVCCLYISLGLETQFSTIIAWLFVILRIIHSYIHLTYNHVIHRLLVFVAGFLCIIILWANLVITQLN
ncbi:MAPEG family protein [Thalassotalea sp. PLHSN55]|uniref:MAPEG family protein n=1 Tax=Thalassotalea sp. PLHSN55 TaxID=3435888 RepID=UPI003F878C38